MLSKSSAQKRADRIGAFREELTQLASDGVLLLSAEQSTAIKNHHDKLLSDWSANFDIDQNAQLKQLSWGMKIASFLGALALAASVFFLFHKFWGVLNLASQMLVLIGAPVVTLLATYGIAARDASGYFVKLAALTCFSCFVLDLMMVGRLWNLEPSDLALLVWAAFALILAYSLDIRLLLLAGLICLASFLAARFGTFCGGYWASFGEHPENFLPPATLLFFLPQFLPASRRDDFAIVYRVFALVIFFLPVLILSNWGEGSYFLFDPAVIEAGYQISGFVLSALLVWYGVRKSLPHVVNTANTFFVIFLYTKFFDWWWESMPKYLFFFIIAVTAIFFLALLQKIRKKQFALLGVKA